MHPLQVSKDGHRTGVIHSEKVESNICKILSIKSKEFKDYKELFILSVVACLHDIGKREDVNYDHGFESSRLIAKNHPEYKLEDKGIADIVAKIAGAHHNDDFFEDLEDEVIITQRFNLKQLASIFRLADALDSDYTRVEKEKIESEKDRFRHIIYGWEPNEREKGFIDIHAKLEKDEDMDLMNKGLSMMERQLECVKPYLLELDLPTELNLIPEFKEQSKLKIDIKRPTKNFVGLNSLTENNILIGRDRETLQICRLATQSPHHISLLTGYSGVGKTSLIQAGLSDKMKYMRSFKRLLIPIYENPINDIIVSINLNLLKRSDFDNYNLDNTIDVLSSSFDKILLILDQFERITDSSKKKLEQFKKFLQSIYLKKFRNIYVLIIYRKESHVDVIKFLYDSIRKEISSKTVLEEIFREGFSAEGKALDKEATLLRRIIKDLITESNHICPGKIFPPFIQIVGMELVQYAKNDIITPELYEQLGRANIIINTFLLKQLDSFEPHLKEIAEEVLKKLVFNGKRIFPIHMDNLFDYLDIDKKSFNTIINLLDEKRLVHKSGEYIELIHDYLAERIETELVGPSERQYRNVLYSFKIKSENFELTKEYLNSFEMVVLYSQRKKFQKELKINGKKKRKFLFRNILQKRGPGWWWFKDLDREELSFLVFDIIKNSNSKDRLILDSILEIFNNFYSHDDLPQLREMLKDEDFKVRVASVGAIAKLRSKEDLPQLRERLKDEDSKVRVASVEAIAKLRSKEDLPQLRERLKDEDSKVRVASVGAIAKLGSKEDLPQLRERIKDEDSKVRLASVEAIAKLRSKEDLPQLRETLKDKEHEVRVSAIEAIAELDSKKALSQLKEMLKDKDYKMRVSAIEAIAKLRFKEALPQLRQMLKDYDYYVSIATVKAIAKLGSKEVLPQLREMLKGDSYARIDAVDAIIMLDAKEVLPQLSEMLKDDDSSVRRIAVYAIAKLDAKQILPQISEILNDDDSSVRRIAVGVIAKLGSKEYLPKLRELLKDDDYHVRLATVKAIVKLGAKEDIKNFLIYLINQACNDPKSLNSFLNSIIEYDEILYSPFKKETL
ncbi:MAG: HEAT repeat domain-containing protein [Promethearchaeota archaeon]